MNPDARTQPLGAGQAGTSSGLAWLSRGTRDLPAWSVSFALHLGMMAVLGTMTHYVATERDTVITTALADIDPEQFQFKIEEQAQIGNDSNLNSLTSSQEAAASLGKNPREEVIRLLDEKLLTVSLPVSSEIPEPMQAELLERIETEGGTEHPGGIEGAVDRLAFEIANSLRERKTLVVWMFDVSPSLRARRLAIAQRFENVYRQIGMFDVDTESALLTSIVSFGERTRFVTSEPTSDVAAAVEAVRGITSESSGTENTFAAVANSINKHLTFRTRQRYDIMVIVVTDEVGSDADRLEPVISQARRYGIRCYCVGDVAPFGRRDTEIPFTLETGDQIIGVMHRGPESYYPERIQLPYWDRSPDSFDQMSSGFGPYALTRLCAETNGLYLVAEEGPTPHFDAQLMRNYAPDYRPIQLLENDVRRSPAKKSLVEVAANFDPEALPLPTQSFRADTDTNLRQAIDRAQRPVADIDYKVAQMQQVLEQGEKDRESLNELRWRAGYDLALGRVLAVRARTFGYNAVLAEMKSAPRKFQKQGNNLWRLEPSAEITAGVNVKKLATRAQAYLSRVIDEHPNTPWARLAERELRQPMGWAWVEGYMAIETPQEREERPRVLFADEPTPRPTRPTRQLPIGKVEI